MVLLRRVDFIDLLILEINHYCGYLKYGVTFYLKALQRNKGTLLVNIVRRVLELHCTYILLLHLP